MKPHVSFIKAIAITTIGSSFFYAGVKLGNSPAAIAMSIVGISAGAFGMARMIHEFEKGDLIDQLRGQAMFWEQEAQKQLAENRELLDQLNYLKAMSSDNDVHGALRSTHVIPSSNLLDMQDLSSE